MKNIVFIDKYLNIPILISPLLSQAILPDGGILIMEITFGLKSRKNTQYTALLTFHDRCS
jgi:hypothetical protein